MSGGPGARLFWSDGQRRRRRSIERSQSQWSGDVDSGASRTQSPSSSSSPPPTQRYTGYVHTLKPDYGFIRRRGAARDLHFSVHAVERGPVRLHSRVTCEATTDDGRPTAVRVRLADDGDDRNGGDGAPGSRAARDRLPDGWTERRVYRGTCARAYANGFGFVQPDDRAVKAGDTVFFHTTGLAPGVATVALHQLVTFELRLDRKYGLCAIEVAPVSDYGSEEYRRAPASSGPSARRRQRSASPQPLQAPKLSPQRAYPRDLFVTALAASSSSSPFSHHTSVSAPQRTFSHSDAPLPLPPSLPPQPLLSFAPQLSIAIDRPSAANDARDSTTMPQRSPRTPLTPTVVFDTWHRDWQPPGVLAYGATDRNLVPNLLRAVSSSVTYPDSPPSSPTPPSLSQSQSPHSSSFHVRPFERGAVAPPPTAPSSSHPQQAQWVTTHCHRSDPNAYFRPHDSYPPLPLPPPPPQYPTLQQQREQYHPTPIAPSISVPLPLSEFYAASSTGGGDDDDDRRSESPCTDASELMRALDALGTTRRTSVEGLGGTHSDVGGNRTDDDGDGDGEDESKEELYVPEPASLTPLTVAPATVASASFSSSSSSSSVEPQQTPSGAATRADRFADPKPHTDVWDRRETFTDFVDYFRALAGTVLSTAADDDDNRRN